MATYTVGQGGTYSTIQEALNAAANNGVGDIIEVAAGTYAEQLTIGTANNNDTIMGAGQGSTIIQAPSGPLGTNITAGLFTGHEDQQAIIGITGGATVTIADLTVDGNNAGGINGGNNQLAGIASLNSNLTVDDVRVTNVRGVDGDGNTAPTQNMYGIIAETNTPSGGAPSNLVVTNSTVDNFGKGGIYAFGSNQTANISNNTITSAPTGGEAQNAILVGLADDFSNNAGGLSGTTGTVSGNSISNLAYIGSSQDDGSTAILALSPGMLTVSGNSIAAASGLSPDDTARQSGISVSDATGTTTVANNTVAGYGADAVTVSGMNTMVSGNATTDPNAPNNVTIIAGSGNDTLSVGGNSTLIGGGGNDVLTGSGGSDVIYGNQGTDRIGSFGGNSTVFGGQGFDTITSGAGDVVYGNAGADLINLSGGNSAAFGGQGSDIIYGSAVGSDTIEGNAGADTIVGGVGAADTILGGLGNDLITATGGLIYGNQGDDIIAVSGASTVVGGSGADSITGATAGNGSLLFGNAGADSITGGVAGDTIFGGRGDDTLSSAGGSLVSGGAGADLITAGTAGGDTISGGIGADTINVTGGADTIQIAALDSGVSATTVDLIQGFTSGSDVLDMQISGTAGGFVAGMTSGGATGFDAASAEAATLLQGNVYAFVSDGTNGFLFADFDRNGSADEAVTLAGLSTPASFKPTDIV